MNLITVLMISYFMIKIYNISTESYFDKGSRFDKKYTINNTLAKGIYTTKERSKIINDVLEVIDSYVDKDDYLLVYDNAPMLNFLTKTKPYMGISWVWVYDSKTFDTKLKKAEKEIITLPIVVQQKFTTIAFFSEPDKDYMSETKKRVIFIKEVESLL